VGTLATGPFRRVAADRDLDDREQQDRIDASGMARDIERPLVQATGVAKFERVGNLHPARLDRVKWHGANRLRFGAACEQIAKDEKDVKAKAHDSPSFAQKQRKYMIVRIPYFVKYHMYELLLEIQGLKKKVLDKRLIL